MSRNSDGSRKHGHGNRLRPFLWAAAATILLIPASAMWLDVPGVDWSAADFIVMGMMLGTAIGLYEFAVRQDRNPAYRAASAVAVAAGFLTVWVNLAVGMLGSEADPRNLLFGVVLLVAIAGALSARFRPRGMARAMAASALTQLVVTGVGVATGGAPGLDAPAGPTLARDAALAGCFALPWAISALLYQAAASR